MTSTGQGTFSKTQTAFGIIQAVTSALVPTSAGANPTFTVHHMDGTEIVGSGGTATPFGAYTGAYRWTVDLSAADFERGEHYLVKANYTVSAANRQDWYTFQVT